jgi:hypothetical protein
VTPIFWTPEQLTGRSAPSNNTTSSITMCRDPMLGHAPALRSWLMMLLCDVFGLGAESAADNQSYAAAFPIGCELDATR